jgi:hypothetical protein
MIIPTYLIVPPAIVALNVFMWLYWRRDPDNRVTDPRFMLGIGCVVVVMAQMVVVVQRYDQRFTSMVLFVAAVGFLIVSIRMLMVRNDSKMPGT